MRTITLGIVLCTSLLLVLKAVEAKSYFARNNHPLAFQPHSRYCLVEDGRPAVEVLLRGGAAKTEEDEERDDNDEENDEEENDVESDVEEEDEEEEEEEEVEEDEYDANQYDDEYDDEEEEEKEKPSVTVADKGEFVEPYFMKPQIQLYVLFGSMMITKKLDLFDPFVVKTIRFFFIAQLILQQAFIFYVRIMAKKNNDRTPVQTKNPLSEMLKSQMGGQTGGNDMVKTLASSFLSSETTVMEYDMQQASNMQGGIIFNMAFNWFLHFKMQKTQPVLMQLISGTVQLIYHPLFQVYILGRNLERPFKTQISAAQQMMEAQKETAAKGDTAEETDTKEEEEEEEDDNEEEEEEEEEGEEEDSDEDNGDDTDDDEAVDDEDEATKSPEKDDEDEKEDEEDEGSDSSS